MSPHHSAPFFSSSIRKLTAVFFIALFAAPAARSDGPTENEIRVEVLGLRNDKGVVGCLLFTNADGFPADDTKAAQKVRAVIEHGRTACVFDDPRAGTYAISYMHDENENGKLDTNFLGIPSEGFGASNDAHGAFGPPKFEEAKFEHTLGVGSQIAQLHAPSITKSYQRVFFGTAMAGKLQSFVVGLFAGMAVIGADAMAGDLAGEAVGGADNRRLGLVAGARQSEVRSLPGADLQSASRPRRGWVSRRRERQRRSASAPLRRRALVRAARRAAADRRQQ